MGLRRQTTYAVAVFSLLVLLHPVPYTAPEGDFNLDGQVDALDVQCAVLLFGAVEAPIACLGVNDCPAAEHCRPGWTIDTMCLPDCLAPDVHVGVDMAPPCIDPDADDMDCLGMTHRRVADLNCDGLITSADLVFSVAVVTAKLGLPGTPDIDGDGRLNNCDDDSDGDLIGDDDDCHPTNPDVSTCDDGDPCTADACEEQECVFPPASGPACDDLDVCTHSDTCSDGSCLGTSYSCNDDNVCTDDSCTGDGGCVNTPMDVECPDGDLCNGNETCQAGECTTGSDLVCDDSSPCTDDSCDPGSGCVFVPNDGNSCDDGDILNGAETCQAGACVAGEPLDVVAKVRSPYEYDNYGKPYRVLFDPPTLATPLDDGSMLMFGAIRKTTKCGWSGPCEGIASLVSPALGLFSSKPADQLVHDHLSPGAWDTQIEAVKAFPDGKVLLVWRSQYDALAWGLVLYGNDFAVLKSKRFSYTKGVDSISAQQILVKDDSNFYLLGRCALPSSSTNELGGTWVAGLGTDLSFQFARCHYGYHHSGVDYHYSPPPVSGTCALNSAGSIVCAGAQSESFYGNKEPAARYNQVSVFSGSNGALLSYEASQNSGTLLTGAFTFMTSTLPGNKQFYVGLGDASYPQYDYVYGLFDPETRKLVSGFSVSVQVSGIGNFPMYPIRQGDHLPLPDGTGLIVARGWDASQPSSHFEFIAKVDGDANFIWARYSPISPRIAVTYVQGDVIYMMGSTRNAQSMTRGDLSTLYAVDLEGNTVVEPCAPHQVHTVNVVKTPKSYSHMQFGGCGPCSLSPGSLNLKPASTVDGSGQASALQPDEYQGRCDTL